MRNDFCSNYLEHSSKGKAWANHKYVAKIRLSSGKYFYFYDTKTYQNYLKKQGKSSEGQYAKANPNKQIAEEAAKNDKDLATLAKTSIKGTTIEEKTKNITAAISSGQSKINEALSKSTSSKKSSSSSSKKSSGSSKSSGGSSKKSSGSKSSSSSSSKKSKESSAKEKSSKESSAKTTKTTKAEAKLKAQERAFNSSSLKKLYGVKDDEVNKHDSKEKLMDSLNSYKDGSFGYITSGNTTYKWTKENGKIIFKDFKTDKEVTLPSVLNNIEEFRTDKKKKK